ncbi:MAG: winged helix-turn-helix transcriptional regulator [Acidobacteria bacterium]|nr:winged helix-turn-helix transcriptional regulator [Acidobacteriota bacterium]
MDTFAALAEPTRRSILEMLAIEGQMPATAIYKRFDATPPAISQHLKVLKEAKLVTVQKRAQQRIYYVNPPVVKELEKWIRQFTARVEKQYQRLDALLAREKAKTRPSQPELFD